MTACFLSMLNSACKKNKSFKELPPDPVKEQPVQKIWLPVKLESDKLVIQLKYQNSSDYLLEIENSDGYKSEISYKNDLPLKLRRFRYDKAISFSEYNFSDNLKIKISSFDEDGNLYTPAGHRLLTKNSAQQIEMISHFGADKKLFKEQKLSYSSFNLSAVDNFNYSYDDKNGIFKHLKHAQLLFLETGYDFFNHSANNPVNYSSDNEKTSCTYKYNSDTYPSELILTKNNKSQVFKITYKETR